MVSKSLIKPESIKTLDAGTQWCRLLMEGNSFQVGIARHAGLRFHEAHPRPCCSWDNTLGFARQPPQKRIPRAWHGGRWHTKEIPREVWGGSQAALPALSPQAPPVPPCSEPAWPWPKLWAGSWRTPAVQSICGLQVRFAGQTRARLSAGTLLPCSELG
jgi:hypothetical protein